VRRYRWPPTSVSDKRSAGIAGNVFNLGQIEQSPSPARFFAGDQPEHRVREEAFKFNATTVDRALELVTAQPQGRPAAPQRASVLHPRLRPLPIAAFVDGIRVYLPPTIGSISAFSSPQTWRRFSREGICFRPVRSGAVGGALNLVTRKPTQPFEYEAAPESRLAAMAITTAITARVSWRRYQRILLAGEWRDHQNRSVPVVG